MLGILIIEIIILTINLKRQQEETLGGDGYVNVIDCGESSTGVCLPANTSNCMYQVCTAFGMSIIPQ